MENKGQTCPVCGSDRAEPTGKGYNNPMFQSEEYWCPDCSFIFLAEVDPTESLRIEIEKLKVENEFLKAANELLKRDVRNGVDTIRDVRSDLFALLKSLENYDIKPIKSKGFSGRFSGRNLKRIREMKNISLVELKELTGLAKSTVSDIEHGHSSPSIQTLEKLAAAFNVHISEFFKEDGENE